MQKTIAVKCKKTIAVKCVNKRNVKNKTDLPDKKRG